eukprot:221289-Chlamydomonas_euryale.AAC.6
MTAGVTANNRCGKIKDRCEGQKQVQHNQPQVWQAACPSLGSPQSRQGLCCARAAPARKQGNRAVAGVSARDGRHYLPFPPQTHMAYTSAFCRNPDQISSVVCARQLLPEPRSNLMP